MIHEVTGKYPAVGGFDFMNYSPSRVERGAECQDTDLAMKWWNRGGIVTFCWHWNAPKDLVDMPPDRTWGRGFYTNATTFDIAQAMAEPSSEEYGLIIRDIDAIAPSLSVCRMPAFRCCGDHCTRLREAGSGGAKGPEPCIALWKLMYERMTHHHELNNLIWVWNGRTKIGIRAIPTSISSGRTFIRLPGITARNLSGSARLYRIRIRQNHCADRERRHSRPRSHAGGRMPVGMELHVVWKLRVHRRRK